MTSQALVESLSRTRLEPECVALLHELAGVGRYQASLGAERAAASTASAATRAGLADVEVIAYPGDGRQRWWSFAAPVSWTPERAVLTARYASGSSEVLADFGRAPLSLATYSRPPATGRVRAPLVSASTEPARWRGAVIVDDRHSIPVDALAERTEATGALGIVTCVAGGGAVGRIELPPNANCWAFSVTDTTIERLRDRLVAGTAEADVAIDVRGAGRMPLVTGRLPGSGPEEILVQAHLCHPPPGANDNASGAAAALAVISRLATTLRGRTRPRRSVRVLWAPEIVGTAAYLHDLVTPERLPLPSAVVNLDMVGGDHERSGAVTFVERSLSATRTSVEEAVETSLTAVRARERAGGRDWTWTPRAYRGASDHGLFADPRIACPAVHVGQWPDRFNHTTADTPQALDERSIERVVSAVAAAVLMLASAPALAGVTPWPPEEPAAAEAVVRRWSGPFNLHALRAALDPRTRERLLATCAADRLGSFGALQCLAYAIDATRNREAVRAVAERGFGEPIGEPLSDVFFDAMNQAGWIGVARG